MLVGVWILDYVYSSHCVNLNSVLSTVQIVQCERCTLQPWLDRAEGSVVCSHGVSSAQQVNLRSVGRKRFAHLSENLDEIHVDANIPWGEDTLFTLEFRVDDGGKYALHTCNNKYLSRSVLHYVLTYKHYLPYAYLYLTSRPINESDPTNILVFVFL